MKKLSLIMAVMMVITAFTAVIAVPATAAENPFQSGPRTAVDDLHALCLQSYQLFIEFLRSGQGKQHC